MASTTGTPIQKIIRQDTISVSIPPKNGPEDMKTPPTVGKCLGAVARVIPPSERVRQA